jgi:predicted Zn-dependent peptidase
LSAHFIAWYQENYTAPRIVLAASGVDHDELVSIAGPLLSDIPNVAGTTRPKSTYVGGEYRRTADSSVGIMICIMILSTQAIYGTFFII